MTVVAVCGIAFGASAHNSENVSAADKTSNRAGAQRSQRSRFEEPTFAVGIRAGLNVSDIIMTDKHSAMADSRLKPGFHFGISLDIKATRNFFIQPSLLLSTRGCIHKFHSSGNLEGYNYDLTGKTTSNAYYLELPVVMQLRGRVSDRVRISVEAGGYVAYGLSGKYVSRTTGSIRDRWGSGSFYNGDPETEDLFDVKDGLKRFDAGVRLGAGFHFAKFYVGANYSLGLVNIRYESDTDAARDMNDVKFRNGNVAISVGYNF